MRFIFVSIHCATELSHLYHTPGSHNSESVASPVTVQCQHVKRGRVLIVAFLYSSLTLLLSDNLTHILIDKVALQTTPY